MLARLLKLLASDGDRGIFDLFATCFCFCLFLEFFTDFCLGAGSSGTESTAMAGAGAVDKTPPDGPAAVVPVPDPDPDALTVPVGVVPVPELVAPLVDVLGLIADDSGG